MKQLLQSLRTGSLDALEVPCPAARPGEVLIRTNNSLISPGTERMLLEFGKASWFEKVRQQPEKVMQVLDKIRTDGVAPAIEAVQAKLDQPISLGYSNAGIVIESDVYPLGTRVVSNGPHAEVVRVPKNLTAAIPAGVTDETAAFTPIAAIALEGIRLLAPSLGETIAVSGLGLIGLLAVQLLRTQGCRVLGIDFDEARLALASGFGAETVSLVRGEDPVAVANRITRGLGVDGVLIAAATKSDAPVSQAAQMCRRRGRIVLTGIAGLHISRDDFYSKELSFQVSCSYGPGRYDPAYERDGQDYPPAYVRWTAQRNFEAVLQWMQEGRLSVEPLITHRFPFEDVREAYALLDSTEPSLGILLEYPRCDTGDVATKRRTIEVASTSASRVTAGASQGVPKIAVIGAGNHATRTLLPALLKSGARLALIVSSSGVAAQHAARRFEIPVASSDPAAAFGDSSVDAVVIATRHDTHAGLVCDALRAGKHVFVEKPLALRLEDLDEIEAAWAGQACILMAGFNRRFAPHAKKMRQLLAAERGPKSVVITVNAGAVASDHWTQDPRLGGGRLIGEACHFLDLSRFLVGQPIVAAQWHRSGEPDTATLQVEFEDRSQATVHYFASGNRRYPKERVEVFAGGKVLALDNWRKLRGYGWKGFSRLNLWRQDKGSEACIAAWLHAIETGVRSPVSFAELLEVSRWVVRAADS
jgi:predicted dehydrogenase/threonine dehydrogenase-like Zn-dependent dehydrogenase